MHHLVLERWSRGRSAVHARDPRAKLLALLLFLIALAVAPVHSWRIAAAYAVLLTAGILLARLPWWRMLLRAAAVLPFSAGFAAAAVLGGDSERAAAILIRSYLSALAVLLLAATTPLARLLAALESLHVPRVLIHIVQFLYRYLFVLAGHAQHMRMAAACRGSGSRSPAARRSLFRRAAGAVGVLFARSYATAEGIHRAMLARGFSGQLAMLDTNRFGWADVFFLLIAAAAVLGLSYAAASH